jgi:hypothetical protein
MQVRQEFLPVSGGLRRKGCQGKQPLSGRVK